jgi:hypothetical protein
MELTLPNILTRILYALPSGIATLILFRVFLKIGRRILRGDNRSNPAAWKKDLRSGFILFSLVSLFFITTYALLTTSAYDWGVLTVILITFGTVEAVLFLVVILPFIRQSRQGNQVEREGMPESQPQKKEPGDGPEPTIRQAEPRSSPTGYRLSFKVKLLAFILSLCGFALMYLWMGPGWQEDQVTYLINRVLVSGILGCGIYYLVIAYDRRHREISGK